MFDETKQERKHIHLVTYLNVLLMNYQNQHSSSREEEDHHRMAFVYLMATMISLEYRSNDILNFLFKFVNRQKQTRVSIE